MKRSLSVMTVFGLALSACWWTIAAPIAFVDEVSPEQLLPEHSIVLFHYDGQKKHEPAIRETAAFKALEATGLRDRVFDLVEMFLTSATRENAPRIRQHLDGIIRKGFSLGVAVSPDGQQFTPHGVVVVPDGAELKNTLESFGREANRNFDNDVQQRTVEGREISSAMPAPGIEIAWWTEGSHFVLAAGINPVAQVLGTIKGETGNVTAHPLWNKLQSSDEFAVTHLGWLDTKSLLQQFGNMPFPEPPPGKSLTIAEFVDMLGLTELEAVTVQGGINGAVTWNNGQVVAPGPRKGLLKLLEQRDISFSELPPLPRNSDSMLAWAFDARAATDTIIETIEGFADFAGESKRHEYDAGFAELKKRIGGHPRDVFSAGLGDLFCVYNDPTSMPIPMGIGPVLTAKVEKRAQVEKTLDQLIQLAGSIPDADKVSITKNDKDGQTFYNVQIPGGVPLVPTIMVSDDWIVACLMPGAAQSFSARLRGTIPKWEPSAAVTQALSELPQKFTSIAVSDPTSGYNSMMTLAPLGLGMLQSQVLPKISGDGEPLEMPFGLQDLPSVEEVTAHIFPNVTVTTLTDTGVNTMTRQSVPGTPIGGVGSAAAIPVLVALLLPAVQQAREAARRTQSKNNLKQIGLAMHNYHSVYNRFPRGTVENTELKPDERLSWIVGLLPFLEQQSLHSEVDQTSGWQSEANKAFSKIAIKTFHNPSQTRPADHPGSMDYIGMAGVGPKAAELPANDPKAGIFGYDRETRIRDILDGTSNTLMVTDSSTPSESWMQGGRGSIRGFSQKPYVNGPDGIGSPHAGGFQVVLADGSVRFISEDVDPSVLEALATKSGGEVIGEL